MKKMYQYICGIALSTLISFGLCSAVFATDLTKHHQEYVGIKDCMQCHTATPPTEENVSFDKCFVCHGGSYEGLAKTTAKLDPNPHYTHLGDITCNECHRFGGRESVNMCANCHNLELNVP